MNDLTACRRSWLTLSAVGWSLSPHPVATTLPKRPKLRPQRSPLYSASETTRSDWALSPTSLGRAEMPPATICPSLRFRLSAWSFCTHRCRRHFVLRCWSIRRTYHAERMLHDVPQAARAIGLQIQIVNASTKDEIEAAFVTLAHDQ